MSLLTYKDFPVDIDHNGQFYTGKGDFEFQAATFEAVKSAIDKELKPSVQRKTISLSVLGTRGGLLVQSVVLGISRTDSSLRLQDKGPELHNVCADTPQNRTRLERLIAARAELDAATKAVDAVKLGRVGYGRIEESSYNQKLFELEKSWNLSLEAQ